MPDRDKPLVRQAGNDMLPVSEQLFSRMLELQSRDFEIRMRELERQEVVDKHSFDYSTRMLEAQKEDRSEERREQTKRRNKAYLFWIIVILFVLLFLGYSMKIGQGELVSNLIEKVVCYALGALSYKGFSSMRKKD